MRVCLHDVVAYTSEYGMYEEGFVSVQLRQFENVLSSSVQRYKELWVTIRPRGGVRRGWHSELSGGERGWVITL